MHYILPKALMTKLSIALSNYNKNKNKRKKPDVYESSSFETSKTSKLGKSAITDISKSSGSIGTSGVVKKVKPVIDDIYGDIFENVGKYVPYGSLGNNEDGIAADSNNEGKAEEHKTISTDIIVNQCTDIDNRNSGTSSAVTSSSTSNDAVSSNKVKSIFDVVSQELNVFKSSTNTTANTNNNSSVKKSNATVASNTAAATTATVNKVSSSSIQPKQQLLPTSSNVIHRDILGMGTSSSSSTGGSEGKGSKPQQGDYLSKKGVQATYDLQPDEEGDNEDDDDVSSNLWTVDNVFHVNFCCIDIYFCLCCLLINE